MGTQNSATLDAQELKEIAAGRELREFKFVVQPVLMLMDGDKCVGEETGEPVTLYGLDQLQAMVDRFPAELDKLNAALRNGKFE
jgi:hypothetical protein